MKIEVHEGDCVDVMASMEEGSIDEVCCDPPYGLSFMGKEWDSPGKTFVERKPIRTNKFDMIGGNHNPTNPQDSARTKQVENQRTQLWHEAWLKECFRILPSGGVVKAFGGSRVYHRLAAAMEEVGFIEIGLIAWGYGSGFPKSHNIAVYMDRMLTEGQSRTIIRKGVGNLNGRFADAAVGFVSQSKAHEVTTPEATPWIGWGTALKPAWEPFLVGRKP